MNKVSKKEFTIEERVESLEKTLKIYGHSLYRLDGRVSEFEEKLKKIKKKTLS